MTKTSQLRALEALPHATYLGDGLYVGLRNDGAAVLWSSDGISVLDVVFLEPTVLQAFELWVKRGRDDAGD